MMSQGIFDLILKVIEICQYCLIKKELKSDLDMSHSKMSDFVPFLLIGFTLVHFESHRNILIFFHKKIDDV